MKKDATQNDAVIVIAIFVIFFAIFTFGAKVLAQ